MSQQSAKTERPSQRRLDKAREDGQVAKSEDTVFVILLGLLFGFLIYNGRYIAEYLVGVISLPTRLYDAPFESAAMQVLLEASGLALTLIISILVTTNALSFVLHWLQFGPLFSLKPISPSLKKLDVVANIKQIFSVKTLVEVIKMLAKSAVLAAIVFFVLKGNLGLLFSLPWRGVAGISYGIGKVMTHLLTLTFFFFALLAIFDILWQRHQHIKQLRMSKEEVKREQKESEGDPHFKRHRRGFFQEIVAGDAERVPLSTAVVTNPTHLAVALYYDPEVTPLPVVIAKGEGDGARTIVSIARNAGVPVIQNIPVARRLYRRDVFRAIPKDLISATAEIVVLAQRMRETGQSSTTMSGDSDGSLSSDGTSSPDDAEIGSP